MRSALVAIAVFWSCSSWALPDEWIFLHGFESEVTVTIEGDQSAVFTESSQERQFALRIQDQDSNVVTGRPILWFLDGVAPFTVSNSDNTAATILAEDFAVASAQLYAIDTGSGSSATASLAMAELAVEAHYLDSDTVVSGGTPEAGVGDIVLVASAETAQLKVGDILVSGDDVGLLVRVVSVSASKGDTVNLSVEPAKITDAFESLSVRARSSVESRVYQLSDSPGRGQKTLSDDLDCETGGENAVGFEISEPSIDLTFDVTTEVELEIVAGAVEQFSLAAVAEAGMEADSGSLTYTSNITGNVTCTFQLPEIFTPPVPVSAFSFQLNTAPTIGIEFEAGFSGPSFNIAGPSGNISGSAKAGLQYASQTGWSPLAALDWSGNFQPLSTDFDASITFTLKGGPFIANEFGLVANLGQPPLGIQLADLRFVRLKALGELDFQLATPLNPERRDYIGPQWDIDAIITGQYQAALADGLLFSLLDALDLPTQIDALTGDIFDPIAIRIAEAPKPQITISCLPSCPLNPNNGDMARLTMTAEGTGSGLATFVAAREGNTFTQDIGSGAFAAGQGIASWTPTVADEGSYEIFPRLVSDALSQLFPYGGLQGQMLNVRALDLPIVFQGRTDSLDVNASGQLAFVASRSGCNGAKAVFLNGAVYACAPSQSWFINQNNQIRLTDAGKVYFDVLQWSHSGELLQGIFKGPNPGGQSGQCWGGDTVVAGAVGSNSTLGYFVEDAAENGDVAWIERRSGTFGGQVVTVGIKTSQRCEGFNVLTGNPRDVRITSNRTVVVNTPRPATRLGLSTRRLD